MKKLIMIFVLYVFTTNISLSQAWMQTGGIPDGAGVTDIIVTPTATILVSTASWGSLSGTLGGVRRSTDGGDTWDNVLEGFNGRTLHLGQNGVVFASFWPYPMDEAIYRSTNDGINWTRLHSVNTGDNIFSITSKDNNNTIFIGTRNGVKRSTNAGANWSYVNTGIPVNSWVRDLELDTSTGYVAAATTNGVFITTNSGTSWISATGIDPQDTIVKIMFDYPIPETDDLLETRAVYGSDDGALYYSFEQSIYTSTVLFAIFSDYETTGLVSCLVSSQNNSDFERVRAVTQFKNEGGFWMALGEAAFQELNNGLPNQTMPSTLSYYAKTGLDAVSEVTFYLGSFENAVDGAKIYQLTYVVGIQQISSEIPGSYSLGQNYPNPFNPSTKISFDITSKALTRLSVYNSIGQEVAVLVNSGLSPGSYEYTFDGSHLTSGVYFYRLQTGNFVETKRMILVK